MSAPENLSAQMADKTNDELLAMFKRPEDWLPEALDAARAELQRRGVDTSTIHIGPPPIPNGQPVFFAVSPLKLVLMSTVTFGIYEIYWFYKNWQFIKQRTRSDIMPFWRALFGVIFCYSCFREVKDVAAARGILSPWSPGWLAAGWIIFTLAWRLPASFWLVCWLTPLWLVPVQNVINRLNAIVAPGHNPNTRFSGWNIAATVVGGIYILFMIVSCFLPQ